MPVPPSTSTYPFSTKPSRTPRSLVRMYYSIHTVVYITILRVAVIVPLGPSRESPHFHISVIRLNRIRERPHSTHGHASAGRGVHKTVSAHHARGLRLRYAGSRRRRIRACSRSTAASMVVSMSPVCCWTTASAGATIQCRH